MSATARSTTSSPLDTAMPQWWANGANHAGDVLSLPWKALWEAGIASQKVYAEALNREMELLRTTQERFGRSCQEIIACRKPQDMMALQTSLLSEICEVASAQAKVTSETVEQLRGCYSAAAKDAMEARKV